MLKILLYIKQLYNRGIDVLYKLNSYLYKYIIEIYLFFYLKRMITTHTLNISKFYLFCTKVIKFYKKQKMPIFWSVTARNYYS